MRSAEPNDHSCTENAAQTVHSKANLHKFFSFEGTTGRLAAHPITAAQVCTHKVISHRHTRRCSWAAPSGSSRSCACGAALGHARLALQMRRVSQPLPPQRRCGLAAAGPKRAVVLAVRERAWRCCWARRRSRRLVEAGTALYAGGVAAAVRAARCRVRANQR